MKLFLAPNISGWGRFARAMWGVLLVVLGLWLSSFSIWLRLVLFAAGGFALFEAARGWCIMRACGIKTKL